MVGVDIEQYDEKRPDKYFRGLWQRKTNSSILKAYRSYFSVVASAPIYSGNFTRMVNAYRQRPPFNFSNPLANMGGIIQVTTIIARRKSSKSPRDVPRRFEIDTLRCASFTPDTMGSIGQFSLRSTVVFSSRDKSSFDRNA